MREKIAEIVHEAIFKVTGCKDLKADGMYLSKELEQAILALYQPQPEPTCLDCGHPMSEHRNGCWHLVGKEGIFCYCRKTPDEPDSRKVEHCTDPGHPYDMSDLEDSQQPTPTEQMPLIELQEQMSMLIDASCDWSLNTIQRKNLLCSLMELAKAHDQQVRKEFAEGMPRVQIKPGTKDSILYNSGADEQYEKCQAFIRKEA